MWADKMWPRINELADKIEVDLQPPRRVGRQTQRNNLSGGSEDIRFKSALQHGAATSLQVVDSQPEVNLKNEN